MPQMMPINWIMSFIMFIIIFLIFNIMNYYIINNKNLNNKITNKSKSMNNFNWKW